ncbi:DUF29 family protein [Acetobacter senegalensis]|uniref:DUF29 family protein n=1 Tax=Acetobacter senegalensis TaxID=446692 RepID=UPI0038D10EBE
MKKSEKRELISRLTVLLLHLLKWEFQPVRHVLVSDRRLFSEHSDAYCCRDKWTVRHLFGQHKSEQYFQHRYC